MALDDFFDYYKMGIKTLDEQHKVIFQVSNFLIDCSRDRLLSEDERILGYSKGINLLLNYVKTHFMEEEKFMEAIEYPFLEEHKRLHKKIGKVFVEHIDEFKLNSNFVSRVNLLGMLKSLVINHIANADHCGYGKFYLNNGLFYIPQVSKLTFQRPILGDMNEQVYTSSTLYSSFSSSQRNPIQSF